MLAKRVKSHAASFSQLLSFLSLGYPDIPLHYCPTSNNKIDPRPPPLNNPLPFQRTEYQENDSKSCYPEQRTHERSAEEEFVKERTYDWRGLALVNCGEKAKGAALLGVIHCARSWRYNEEAVVVVLV
jgi:hypothetical protein